MAAESGSRRPNHLAGETSPYLLQHLYNPVDWYPWGEDAHGKAATDDKPVFLSIGYAACHWCHVMERESFEDPEIAEFLNRHFVSIKVDREERPDVDEIYMNAVQLMTGAGGWPLTAFLTPQLEPFFTGTYFPPRSRYGRPGFLELLQRIHEAWSEKREQLVASAGEITERLQAIGRGTEPGGTAAAGIEAEQQMLAVAQWTRRFDPRWGGFGGAPKFPPDGAVAVMIREHLRSGENVPLRMAVDTLDAMAAGGMYDHVGGGFCRYSVDERWLVPHFEKMLYNQALLVPLYVDAHRLTGNDWHRRVVFQTLDFVRREMTDPAGGFYSSLDADSEGEEGKFYVWTPEEVETALGGERAERFCRLYGIREGGNFEGRSIPNLLDGPLEARADEFGLPVERLLDQTHEDLARLLEVRSARVRPGTDDKILTAWNGLMISAFARAHQAFSRPQDLDSAGRAADFVATRMLDGNRLRVSYRDGKSKLNGYLDDYAFFGRGLVDLYEASFDPAWLLLAERLTVTLLDQFEDRERGGFWFVSHDHERLIARNRSAHDGALPAGAGVAVELLARLAVHLDDDRLREARDRALASYRPAVEQAPSVYASMLIAADWTRGPVTEVVVRGPAQATETRGMLEAIHARVRPRLVLAGGPAEVDGRTLPMLRGKEAQASDRPTAFVCRDYACRAPVQTAAALAEQLADAG